MIAYPINIMNLLVREVYGKLMIMDEPTNSLDTETEKLVLSSISSLTKNLTVVVISHSDDNLNFFDKIINLDKYK